MPKNEFEAEDPAFRLPGVHLLVVGDHPAIVESGNDNTMKNVHIAPGRTAPAIVSHGPNATIHDIVVGDQYINNGQAGAIGTQSTGTVNYKTQWQGIADGIDLKGLAGELEKLRVELQKTASSRKDIQEMALIADAEEHAEHGEGSKLMETLSHVSKGVYEVAKAIGVDLVAQLILKSSDLSS